LKFLVARIAGLQPDLLLIEKTASRIAQEFLLAEGITFALNVKPHVLKRIARATGASILASATGI
jgi:1-phosphatidylinositol-3-phosphate 5-kinase